MHGTDRALPVPDQVWMSRPPFLLFARIREVHAAPRRLEVEYELFDEEGSLLSEPIQEVLDSRWWSSFQPLVRRQG